MAQDNKIVQPRITRAPARTRGPLSSEDYNNFQDQVYSDVIDISTAVNSLNARLVKSLEQSESENQHLRKRVEALEETESYRAFINGKLANKIDKYIDFHNTGSIMFPSTLSSSKRAEFKAQFGEIYLPANGIDNKFYNFSLRNGGIVLPNDFSVDVSGTFDKVDGNGTKDYEYGGTVSAGTPSNAFNGINESAWIRTVTFPMESMVDEVECEITAVVPAGISPQANLLELVPYPDSAIDIQQVSTSPDLTSAFVEIDNFEELNNATAIRYHFSPRDVEQIKIRLRCRNWREINGKKVFVYGLQEVGLKLVDYNKTNNSDETFGNNITAIVKIDSPTGHVFNTLYRVDSFPDFYLEDAANRHVRLRLSTTPDFTGTVWDSAQNILPQHGTTIGVSLGSTSTLYAIYTLKFVTSSGGYQSPFPVGTTPVIKGLGLLFHATQTSNS
jgi:hypothetical protein